jgi:lipid A 3-O-deacylase
VEIYNNLRKGLMNMKKLLLPLLCSLLLYGNANAESEYTEHEEKTNGFEISLAYGEGKSDIDIYRLGLKKDYGLEWFKRDFGYLSGFFELSYNYWHYKSEDIHGIALSPVFAYYLGKSTDFFRPYIAGGIGAAVLDRYHIKNRDLGSNFQFEDQIGIGAKIGLCDIYCSFFHYSNAGLKLPNAGIDIVLFSGSFRF